jgi:hypothetical protein
VLTPEEAAGLEKATAAQVARADAPTDPNLKVTDLKNADCGADGISGFNCGYNQGWKDPGEKVVDLAGEKRTSIIISPKNGQFPAMNRPPSPDAARGAAAAFDGPGIARRRRALPGRLRLHLRPADAAGHVQQQLPDRADQGRGADRGGDGARRAHGAG